MQPRIHFILDPDFPEFGHQWPYEQKKIDEVFPGGSEIHLVRGREHAGAITREILKQNPKLIVCVGNDKTLHEIVNALATKKKTSDPILTIYKKFHRGDFVRSIPLRDDFLEFLEEFKKGESASVDVDLGEIKFAGQYGQSVRRVFLNYACVGYGSSLLQRFSRLQDKPLTWLRMFKEMMTSLPFSKMLPLKVQTETQNEKSTPLLSLFFNNSPFVGRGIRISPMSSISDGVFELTQMKKASRIRYLLAALELVSGKLRQRAFVEIERSSWVRLSPAQAGKQVRVSFDGESRGFLPCEIQVLKHSLKILI